jgi:hypothetical protein
MTDKIEFKTAGETKKILVTSLNGKTSVPFFVYFDNNTWFSSDIDNGSGGSDVVIAIKAPDNSQNIADKSANISIYQDGGCLNNAMTLKLHQSGTTETKRCTIEAVFSPIIAATTTAITISVTSILQTLIGNKVTATTNSDFYISTDATWLTLPTGKQTGGHGVTVSGSVLVNDSVERSANITITNACNTTGNTYKLTQMPKGCILTITPSTSNVMPLSKIGDSVTYDVAASNLGEPATVTIVVPNTINWLTIYPTTVTGKGTVTVTLNALSENTETTNLVFMQPCTSQTLYVARKGTGATDCGLTVDGKTNDQKINVAASTDKTDYKYILSKNVKCDYNISVTESVTTSTAITVDGETQLTVTIPKADYTSHTYNVSVALPDVCSCTGTHKIILAYTQDALPTDCTFSINNTPLDDSTPYTYNNNIASAGETITLNLTANSEIKYTISDEQNLTATPSKDYSQIEVTIPRYSFNNNITSYSFKINFTSPCKKTILCTFNQDKPTETKCGIMQFDSSGELSENSGIIVPNLVQNGMQLLSSVNTSLYIGDWDDNEITFSPLSITDGGTITIGTPQYDSTIHAVNGVKVYSVNIEASKIEAFKHIQYTITASTKNCSFEVKIQINPTMQVIISSASTGNAIEGLDVKQPFDFTVTGTTDEKGSIGKIEFGNCKYNIYTYNGGILPVNEQGWMEVAYVPTGLFGNNNVSITSATYPRHNGKNYDFSTNPSAMIFNDANGYHQVMYVTITKLSAIQSKPDIIDDGSGTGTTTGDTSTTGTP